MEYELWAMIVHSDQKSYNFPHFILQALKGTVTRSRGTDHWRFHITRTQHQTRPNSKLQVEFRAILDQNHQSTHPSASLRMFVLFKFLCIDIPIVLPPKQKAQDEREHHWNGDHHQTNVHPFAVLLQTRTIFRMYFAECLADECAVLQVS